MIFFFTQTDGWESCSDDEDDSDGEWIDVHHSSDEDQGQVSVPDIIEEKQLFFGTTQNTNCIQQ